MDSPDVIVLAAMESPDALAASTLSVAGDWQRLAENREAALQRERATVQNLEAALQRERATVQNLVAQRARVQSLLQQVRRHLRAGDAQEAQELLGPDDDVDTENLSEDDDEAEDGMRCFLCDSSSGRLVFYTMAPEGPWAGLEPSARIVCGSCHDESMGRVDTAATLRAWTAA